MIINRNDPCPCGSGKKYKKCCLEKHQSSAQPEGVAETFTEVRQLLAGKEFASLDEVNAFLTTQMSKRNQAPKKDFAGLSPEQIHRFLHFPFESDALSVFPERIATQPSAPILDLFSMLAEAIGEKGLKPTATGNLPRNFCREAALSYWGDVAHGEKTRYGNINKEEDFFDLHVTRIVAEVAGLIRKYQGKFILSRECRRLLGESGMSYIYPRLFRTYVEKFNWGYWDGYPELGLIQQSFLFSLYLLHRHGGDWRPQTFYEDHFLQAFPMILEEVPAGPYTNPDQTVRFCYSLRSMEHFWGFLGLAKIEPISTEQRYPRQFRVRKLPLLGAIVKFGV
jgi:hypothetical protein